MARASGDGETAAKYEETLKKGKKTMEVREDEEPVKLRLVVLFKRKPTDYSSGV